MKIRFKKESHLEMWNKDGRLAPERFSIRRVEECDLVSNEDGVLTVTFYEGNFTAEIPEDDIIIVE